MERLPVGKIIQGLRKAKGITQEELAEVLGVSSAAISKWEHGQMYPDITLFPVIARYFNISIDCLFGFSNDLSEEEYLKNRQECIKLFASGKCLNGIERIKRLVYLYPTNDRIKIDLLKNVLPYLVLEKDSEIRENLIRQMILICQRCIDDSVQSQKHFLLAHLFIMIKKYEDASACLVDENEFMAIDMKNSLILRENNANAIDIIDSTINMLGIQLIYELRNKVSKTRLDIHKRYFRKAMHSYNSIRAKPQFIFYGLYEHGICLLSKQSKKCSFRINTKIYHNV